MAKKENLEQELEENTTSTEEVELDEGIIKPHHTIARQPWSQSVKDMKGTAGEYSQIAKGKNFTVWTGYSGSLKRQAHYVVGDDKIIGSGWTMNSALKDAGLNDRDLTHRSKFADGSILNKGMREEQELEETMAADTIATKGDASEVGQMPKSAAMAHVMGMMQGMDNPNLKNFMMMLNQYGPHNNWGIDDSNASHNQATITMKPSNATASAGSMAAEDLKIAFDGEELTEDFKTKASTIFEAAVNAKLVAETTRLEEEYEAKLTEQVEVFTEELTTKLDSYLDYAVSQWMEENQVAIESTLQTELTQDFINGLKNLFAEHYIDVPADKIDVLESMAEKVQVLETKLDEMITENSELRGVIIEESAKDLIENVSSDLALTQKEKFFKIVEGLEFDGDLEVFEQKLVTIKESYFGNKNVTTESNILEESFDGDIDNTPKYTDPNVGRYVEAISKSIKK